MPPVSTVPVELLVSGAAVARSTERFLHHDLNAICQLPTARSKNRRSTSQRCSGFSGPGEAGPAPPIRSGSRGPRPTGRPSRGSRVRRECGRSLDVVTETLPSIKKHDKLKSEKNKSVESVERKSEKNKSVESVGDDFVHAIIAKVLEDSDCKCVDDMSDDEDWEDMCTHTLLMPQHAEVLLSIDQEHAELEEAFADDLFDSQDEAEVYSSEFVGGVLNCAVQEFTDNVTQEVVFKNEESGIASVLSLPAHHKHKIDSDGDMAPEDDMNEGHQHPKAEKGKKDGVCHLDEKIFSGEGEKDFENDDDCGSSVVIFGSDCEMEVNHEIAQWMAEHLVNGPNGLLEASVRMSELAGIDGSKDVAFPATMPLQPCLRRSFPRRLKSSSDGPIVPQKVYPTDCLLPMSQSVVSVVAPFPELEQCLGDFMSQPHPMLSPEAAGESKSDGALVEPTSSALNITKDAPRAHVPSCPFVQQPVARRRNCNRAAVVKQQNATNQPQSRELPVQQTVASTKMPSPREELTRHPPPTSGEVAPACRPKFGTSLITGEGKSTNTIDLPEVVTCVPPRTGPHRPTTRRRAMGLCCPAQLENTANADTAMTKSTHAPMPPPPQPPAAPPLPQTVRRRPYVGGKKSVESAMTARALMADACTQLLTPTSQHSPPSVSKGSACSTPRPELTTTIVAPVQHSERAEKSQALVGDAGQKHGTSEKLDQSIRASTPGRPLSMSVATPRRSVESKQKYVNDPPTPTSAKQKHAIDPPTSTSARRRMSATIAAAVARYETPVGTPVGTPAAPCTPRKISRNRTSRQQITTYRMDNEDNAVERAQPARPSSLTRGYQTLGVEMFNLDSDVESKPRRPKLHKVLQPLTVPFSATLPRDSPQSSSFFASSGRAALGSFRGRGTSPAGCDPQDVLGARSEQTAMELDLGLSRAPHPCVGAGEKCSTHSMLLSEQESPGKFFTKSSLLPSLAGPGKMAETPVWSIKMVHGSAPCGGHRSVF